VAWQTKTEHYKWGDVNNFMDITKTSVIALFRTQPVQTANIQIRWRDNGKETDRFSEAGFPSGYKSRDYIIHLN